MAMQAILVAGIGLAVGIFLKIPNVDVQILLFTNSVCDSILFTSGTNCVRYKYRRLCKHAVHEMKSNNNPAHLLLEDKTYKYYNLLQESPVTKYYTGTMSSLRSHNPL